MKYVWKVNYGDGDEVEDAELAGRTSAFLSVDSKDATGQAYFTQDPLTPVRPQIMRGIKWATLIAGSAAIGALTGGTGTLVMTGIWKKAAGVIVGAAGEVAPVLLAEGVDNIPTSEGYHQAAAITMGTLLHRDRENSDYKLNGATISTTQDWYDVVYLDENMEFKHESYFGVVEPIDLLQFKTVTFPVGDDDGDYFAGFVMGMDVANYYTAWASRMTSAVHITGGASIYVGSVEYRIGDKSLTRPATGPGAGN